MVIIIRFIGGVERTRRMQRGWLGKDEGCNDLFAARKKPRAIRQVEVARQIELSADFYRVAQAREMAAGGAHSACEEDLSAVLKIITQYVQDHPRTVERHAVHDR